MPSILSVGTAVPPYEVAQQDSMHLSRELFEQAFPDIDRLLKIFASSQIRKRHFAVPLDWFTADHPFAEKNRLYLELAPALCKQAIEACLQRMDLALEQIDCVVLVSSTGIATPSLDAHLVSLLPFRENVTRIPLWGLGCAGGAMGLSRAADYAKAYPESLVLLIAVELCSLTFIRSDLSKSNLVASALFADGAAAVLIAGDRAKAADRNASPALQFLGSRTTTWRDTLDIMGWELQQQGLRVLFSRDIPTLVRQKMGQNVEQFLSEFDSKLTQISQFIFHPGGTKVLDAYRDTLGLSQEQIGLSEAVLNEYGNMSSPTVLFVLAKSMQKDWSARQYGLVSALGPGFSSELILLEAR
ncbi:type III polyketide synthase [Brevibacillus fulvus]|uniref:Alkylresorcinol/alkylpyrone synthase n=1 Tax=Brevibacillus fulvus TaxID=1125967 RepID=A0A939BRG4_9BACL|nr:3-oxoacyl-[acyl-carrier-protein] synthase III C-terminal domain-containing protein [Brevibacillus fulvus]MBM7589443.1 alkylresorcinol/alkylpyrone synthase [Brevibacillus fulvus]